MNHDAHFFISEPDKVHCRTGFKNGCFPTCAVQNSECVGRIEIYLMWNWEWINVSNEVV